MAGSDGKSCGTGEERWVADPTYELILTRDSDNPRVNGNFTRQVQKRRKSSQICSWGGYAMMNIIVVGLYMVEK